MDKTASKRFERPRPANRMSPAQQADLLRDYLAFYEGAARQDHSLLNRKMPRGAASDFLDRVGVLICEEARKLADPPGPLKAFLDDNPLPPSMADYLPPEFRAYCLLLNALKQWTAAEQAATDKAILGTRARHKIREASARCVISGEPLGEGCELHHPVRDGRPPIPISKSAHALLEGQVRSAASGSDEEDALLACLGPIRRERSRSWRDLHRGCLELLGRSVSHSTPAVRAGARSFARRCIEASGVQAADIVDWLVQTERV